MAKNNIGQKSRRKLRKRTLIKMEIIRMENPNNNQQVKKIPGSNTMLRKMKPK